MFIDKISIGKNVPEEVNVIIEISKDEGNIKYEIDKESGAFFVDRFMKAPMYYPCNYGFIPHTLSDDGDPVDVLVLTDNKIIPGSVIPCKVVGVLLMEDESGQDEKIIAVPTNKIDVNSEAIQDLKDVTQNMLDKIKHFFENYKTLDKGKWVKVAGYAEKAKALELINNAIARANKQ